MDGAGEGASVFGHRLSHKSRDFDNEIFPWDSAMVFEVDFRYLMLVTDQVQMSGEFIAF